LLILYLDHGSHFAAEAARTALLSIVQLALFGLILGYLSRRHDWLLTLVVSWAVVLLADLALHRSTTVKPRERRARHISP
jgi:hypothetical protein